jgi:ATP-dependent Zn protease
MSPSLAETVDKEIARLVREASKRAKELLLAHRERLSHVAAKLLEAEVLEGKRLDDLLHGVDEASDAGADRGGADRGGAD